MKVNKYKSFFKTNIVGKFKLVIINLTNNNRPVECIGGMTNCNHDFVKAGRCTNCGAFVNQIGMEIDILDFYRHSHMMVMKLKHNSDCVVIMSKSIIPVEYRFKLFGNKIVYPYFCRSSMYCSNDQIWMNIFSNKKSRKNVSVTANIVTGIYKLTSNISNDDVLFFDPNEDRDLGNGFNFMIHDEDIFQKIINNTIFGKYINGGIK